MKEKYKNELRIVKNYLALKPNRHKYIVAAETGISLDIIIELIETGFLIEESGELRITRNKGRSSEERKKLVQGLRKGIEIEKIEEQRKNEEGKSQLLIDLEDRKKGIEHNAIIKKENGWER